MGRTMSEENRLPPSTFHLPPSTFHLPPSKLCWSSRKLHTKYTGFLGNRYNNRFICSLSMTGGCSVNARIRFFNSCTKLEVHAYKITYQLPAALLFLPSVVNSLASLGGLNSPLLTSTLGPLGRFEFLLL